MSAPAPTERIDGHALRPEIQALRAVAVALVVIYHLWPSRLPGGYVGVDVFFVISGFLITAHLATGILGAGRFSLTGFYLRRVRRLLPASLLVLLVVAIATIVWVPQTLWNGISKQVLGSVLYVQNWVLAADSVDYLAAASDASPVQHFWSLSVEEQFYAVWPVLLLLGVVVARRLGSTHGRVGLLSAIAAVTAASFVFSLIATAAGPWAYFVTPTRAWEFGLGGLCALLWARPRGPRWVRTLLSWGGLATILASAVLLTAATPFPGSAALLPVLGTLAVIAAGDVPGRWSPAFLQRLRPVQFLGSISYSVYLWHWPLIVLLPIVVGGYGSRFDSPLERGAIVVLSIGLGWLTKRFVEDRFRGGTRSPLAGPAAPPRSAPVFLSAVAGMLVVAAVAGGTFALSQARVEQARASLADFLAAADDCQAAARAAGTADAGCFVAGDGAVVPDPVLARTEVSTQYCQQSADRDALLRCDFGRPDAAFRVALVGDSHANQWTPLVARLAELDGWSLTTYLKSGCPFTDDGDRIASCRAWNGLLGAELESREFDLILTSGAGLLDEDAADAGRRADAVAGLESAWRPLAERGIPVVAIAEVPWPRQAAVLDPPSCVDAAAEIATCGFPLADGRVLDPQLDAVEAVDGALLLDLTPAICPDGTCAPVIGGVLVYRDDNHLTDVFSLSLLGRFADRLDELLDAGPR